MFSTERITFISFDWFIRSLKSSWWGRDREAAHNNMWTSMWRLWLPLTWSLLVLFRLLNRVENVSISFGLVHPATLTEEQDCCFEGKQNMTDSLVPVFVFPNSLKFNLADQSTHKQVLTLYNPYDFPVKFQVLGSSKDRKKYTVVDPEGRIQTHCCVDIVIRHNNVTSQYVGQTDKFRIQMFNYATNKLIGKKDITAELLAEELEKHTPEKESFQELPINASGQPPAQYSLPKRPVQPSPPNGLFISVAVICITTLLLPSAGEISSLIPEYLKPSVHLKLVVSYVLGLVTMVLLRPT